MNSAVNSPAASDNPPSYKPVNFYREPISRRAAAIMLLLLPIVFAAPIMLAGYSLTPPADMGGVLGLHLAVGRNIVEGALPFLNPYILSAAPLLFATISSGALYPPSW